VVIESLECFCRPESQQIESKEIGESQRRGVEATSGGAVGSSGPHNKSRYVALSTVAEKSHTHASKHQNSFLQRGK